MNLVYELLDPSLQSPTFPSFPSAFNQLDKYTKDYFNNFRSVEKDHLKFFVGHPDQSVDQLEKDIKAGLAFLGDYGANSYLEDGRAYVQKKDLLARMIVYASTDGAFLLERHALIPPVEDDVMVFFIELPSGDKYSDTVFAAVAGKNAIKYIMDVYGANWDAVTNPITIPTAYRELILKLIIANKQEDTVISAYTIAMLGLKKIGEVASSILVPLLLDITKLEKFFSETLHIDEATWNVDHQGHPQISAVDLIEAKIKSYSNFLDGIAKSIPDDLKFLKLAFYSYVAFLDGIVLVIKGIEIVSEFLFAAVCGIWNSLMDLISGVISLIKMVVEIVYGITDLMANGEYYKNYLLEQIDNITQAIENIDWKEVIITIFVKVKQLNDSVSELPGTLLKKLLEVNHTEMGYFTGYLLFEVVQMVFPVGLILKGATSAAKLSKFGRIFELGDKFSDLNKAAEKFHSIKANKNIVQAGVSRTEIQAFLDLLKTISEKMNLGTKGFISWLEEIFEELRKLSGGKLGIGKKVNQANFKELRKKYGKLVSKGSSRIKNEYSVQYKKLLKQTESSSSKKKFDDDYAKKIPKPKSKEGYLKKRKQAFINFEKGSLFERIFKQKSGGDKPIGSIKTAFTHRFVDNVKDDIARELKSGYVKMSKEFKKQVRKDIDIIERELSSYISKVEWHIIEGIDEACLTYIYEIAKSKKVLDKITIIFY